MQLFTKHLLDSVSVSFIHHTVCCVLQGHFRHRAKVGGYHSPTMLVNCITRCIHNRHAMASNDVVIVQKPLQYFRSW